MSPNLSALDKRILNRLQEDIPFVRRPWEALAKELDIREARLIERIGALKKKGIIRRISAVFSPRNVNFVSTLVAVKTAGAHIAKVARRVNLYQEVTHNYERNSEYNLWFTLVARNKRRVGYILGQLRKVKGIERISEFPAIKLFKIEVKFMLRLFIAVSFLSLLFAAPSIAATASENCVACHRKLSPALVMEWESSRHGQSEVGCLDCHGADKSNVSAWTHEGEIISTLVTPKNCAQCHSQEYEQFSHSYHATAGEIINSLDNVLAIDACGMPGNIADAVNGCWQCHGSIVKFKRDKKGNIVRQDGTGKPEIDTDTWPNSGIGRLNPDGSKGSCHACHSRHAFQAKLSRSPENCGKCHMGPDHPQIEIYNESKHGIAFYANRDRMALDKEGSWVLGKDYSAAPTCATCHIAGFMTPDGVSKGNSHDVGERISWTLRPIVSTKINLVIYEDGYKETYPDTRPLPKVGDKVETIEKVVENDVLVNKKVERHVSKIVPWQERRNKMKMVCLNCHSDSYINNFYKQYDSLVILYNEKFGAPAQVLMKELEADGALKANAPFEHELQWVFYELWHHEGRRARHGASMMGPDYTHWHGMYEVAKHFYTKFLPQVIEVAAEKSPALKEKYEKKVQELLKKDEHIWKRGLKPDEAERLRKAYKDRYNE